VLSEFKCPPTLPEKKMASARAVTADSKHFLPAVALTLTLSSVGAEQTHELPALTVEGAAETDVPITVDATRTAIAGPGTAELLKQAPGADVNFNGPLTGIAQYRGLFGNRLNLLINGVYTNSACPNEMEPPLHYVSLPRLDSLELIRGITPVSSGLETLGGTISARPKAMPYGAGESAEAHGYVDAIGHTVDDGYSVGGAIGVANRRHKLYIGGSRDQGGDTRFGSGTIRDSAYKRNAYDVTYGFQSEERELGLTYLRNETKESGTPALPMDIIFVDTNIAKGEFNSEVGELSVTALIGYTDVHHLMDNYSLRLSPPQQRFSRAESSGWSYKLTASRNLGLGELLIGADGNLTYEDATIFDPNNASFFVDNFNDVDRDRYGFFAEWRAPLAAHWRSELGLRYTRVDMDAGTVDATPAQMMVGPRILRDRFNAAKRNKGDDNIDWVAKEVYQPLREVAIELGAARKTRSPSYQERYLWLPLQSTGGLADGHNYVGIIDLDPEVSHQVELGVDWRTERFYLAPRGFYRRVADYIQGTPATDPVVIAVSAANGDASPLQFSNVDAEFYGVDVDWGVSLSDYWYLGGILSYVRGKRLDIDDDLYRIAPLNATVALTYERPRWFVTVEGVFYDKQDNVSVTNGETPSSGYGLMNLFGEVSLGPAKLATATLRAGLSNLLDETYRPHLNGINRVRESDVGIGERLPGPGRNVFASLRIMF
jgi:iron complex outermembrane receptor protein